MKKNVRKMRILPLLLVMALMLAIMPTQAMAAATNFPAIVTSDYMHVFRDSGFQYYWGTVPRGTVLTVVAYSGNLAMVRNGAYVGYAQCSDMDTVANASTAVVAKQSTYVFQYPNVRSRHMFIPVGTAMNLLAVNGICAQVEKNGIIAYTRVDHLALASEITNEELDAQQRFEQAFKEQQAQQQQQQPVQPQQPAQPVQPQQPAQPQQPPKEETAIEKVFSSGKYSNEELCYAFLVKVCGYNHAAACGIVANIKYESGFKPGSIGDSGNSMGICQWNSSRKTLLINWCNQNGYDPESLLGQLYFLKYELEVRYPKIHAFMLSVENSAQGAYNSAYHFCYNFERPANKESSSNTRGNYAMNTTFNKFANLL